MHRIEKFLSKELPQDFYWFNEPEAYRVGHGLEIVSKEKTDFWQGTHYGFRRDDGHCLFTKVNGDFTMIAGVTSEPLSQYDQCGLMARIDTQNWIKMSTEYETPEFSRLGSVVTNLGYSDWATQDLYSQYAEMWYRMSRRGADFRLEYSLDGQKWHQMRIAHLHEEGETLEVGIYACSPIGRNFRCVFRELRLLENQWLQTV